MKVTILLRVQGVYVSGKLNCITAWKIFWKASFNGSNWLFQNIESLYNLFFMNNVQTQNGKVHEGMLPVFNSDAVEITLTGLCNF